MLRKRVQKLLPSHESIKANRTIAMFGSALQHPGLWHLNRRSVAGGVAVGLFCGLIPGPLQMLGSVLLSIPLRVNLPVALVATFYSNPFTIVPLYYVAYKLGVLVTGGAGAAQPVQPPELTLSNPGEWIPATFAWVASMGKPLAIGLPLLAGILAVLGYFAVLGAWRLYVVAARQKRTRAR
jgi:uncharacterized protein (DUF2062 family)